VSPSGFINDADPMLMCRIEPAFSIYLKLIVGSFLISIIHIKSNRHSIREFQTQSLHVVNGAPAS
jgi:hypothetical protein